MCFEELRRAVLELTETSVGQWTWMSWTFFNSGAGGRDRSHSNWMTVMVTELDDRLWTGQILLSAPLWGE